MAGDRRGRPLIFVVIAACASVAAAEPDRRLVEAAKGRDLAAVRALAAEGVEVDVRQGDGASALHWAAHWDAGEMADILIQSGATVDAADDHGVTPIGLAALNGSAAMVRRLLEAGANPDLATTVGMTPLMTAARTGNVEAVRLLLRAGASHAAAEASLGQTPLMFAVAENHHDIARTLIEAGADVRARSANRFTPLLFAAQQGNIAIARLLLAAGAAVDESAPDGIAGDTNAGAAFRPDTDAAALMVAIDSGHDAMAGFLLERGADPNHAGAGRTALHSAVQQRMPGLVRQLLARGADPDARLTKPMPALSRLIRQDTGVDVRPLGATPFWLAASYGDVAMMRLLVAGGADPGISSYDQTTALMVAAGIDFVEGQDKYGQRWFDPETTPLQRKAQAAVDYCLELGLDIDAANAQGQRAIFGGVYFRSPEMVKFLVDRGADVNVVNKRGQTPWLVTQGEYRSGSFYVDEETGRFLAGLGADTALGRDLGPEFARAR